jgi:hypothetical protein
MSDAVMLLWWCHAEAETEGSRRGPPRNQKGVTRADS